GAWSLPATAGVPPPAAVARLRSESPSARPTSSRAPANQREVNKFMRSEYCGLVSRAHLGQTVNLFGWVHRRRDHGGVIFIDMRDREGLVQIVCDPDRADTFATAEKIRNEFVVRVAGAVRPRPEGTINANL